MVWKPPSMSEAYTNRVPNELEQSLADQAKPGYIPKETGMLRYSLAHVARLKADDPRRQLLVSRQVNHEELSTDDLAKIFGNP